MTVGSASLHAVWGARELTGSLVGRELRARYKGSALGFAWSLLNPLLMMAVYSLVFAHVMRVQVPHYGVFLLAGLLPWSWFAAGATACAQAVTGNAGLVKKVRFPQEILPLVQVLTHGAHYLLALPVLAGFMLLDGVVPGLALLWLPVLLLIQGAFTLGLGLILATANAFFRDVEQLLGPLLMAWFYLTPVVYPLTFLPEQYRCWLLLNPLTGLFGGYQAIFAQNNAPDLGGLAYAGAWAAGLLILGWWCFAARRHDFAEVV